MIKLSIKNNKLTNSGLLTPKDTLNPKLWADMDSDDEGPNLQTMKVRFINVG